MNSPSIDKNHMAKIQFGHCNLRLHSEIMVKKQKKISLLPWVPAQNLRIRL